MSDLYHIEAEQAALGALLVNPATIELMPFLRAEHFYEPVHGLLFEAIVTEIEHTGTALVRLLQKRFEGHPAFAEIGTIYIPRLAANAVTLANADDYARAIINFAVARRAVEACANAVPAITGAALEGDIGDVIAETEAQLAAAASDTYTKDNDLRFLGDIVSEVTTDALRRLDSGAPSGLRTGLADIDHILGGLGPGDLMILAGRPSAGKTALATCIARIVASEGTGVALFSLEMGATAIGQRAITEIAYSGPDSIAYHALREGTAHRDDIDRLSVIAINNADLPLVVDTSASPKCSTIKAKARRACRMLRERGADLGLIVIDYLQLIQAGTAYRGNRVQEVSEISASLKGMAISLQCPVIALSQLSRQVESREDKRPQLSDLRESGSIEQDADQVAFVFREEYYLARSEPSDPTRHVEWQAKMDEAKNRCEVIIAKNRMGSIGNAKLFFHAPSGAFRDLDRRY